MNCFKLAEIQMVKREGKDKINLVELINKAIFIRDRILLMQRNKKASVARWSK